MKDLGCLRYFLGIEVAFSPKDYLLSQSKYMADTFKCAHLTNARIVATPLEHNTKQFPTDGTLLSNTILYRIIVCNLVYLITTCPDIAHSIHIVSQFVTSLTIVYQVAVVHILRYV